MERVAKAVLPADIRYSQSRTVAVSAEALRVHHISLGNERTPLGEAFKRLRTHIVQRMRASGRNSLGVASPRAGEGKTTVALNLAVHIAQELDWTVLLVEADLRRPGLCQLLGVEPLPGLTEYLVDDMPLDKLLVHPGLGRCL